MATTKTMTLDELVSVHIDELLGACLGEALRGNMELALELLEQAEGWIAQQTAQDEADVEPVAPGPHCICTVGPGPLTCRVHQGTAF